MAAVPAIPGVSKFLGRFLGNSVSTAAGVAIGGATADVLIPKLQDFKNRQWDANRYLPPNPTEMAAGVAAGKVDSTQAFQWAANLGLGPDAFAAMVAVATEYPDVAVAIELDRRSITPPGELAANIEKLGYPADFAGYIAQLAVHILSPSEVANAVQQGHLANTGNILPELPPEITYPAGYAQPEAPDGQPASSVPLTQLGLDPITEAAGSGIDFERLQVQANLAGLPPGAESLLTMWNRNLIDEAAVDAGLREGHLKTKWMGAFKRLRWPVLSHIQYVDARVRGWIDNAGMYAGGALTGHTPAQLDLLHKTHGRPLSWHQVFIGLQRGGHILDPTADLDQAALGIDETFWKALQQSDIQQQWYLLAWAQRYNYPSAFVLRQLRESNEITDAMLRQVLTYIGWEPTFIDAVATAWGGAAKVGTSPYIAKAQTQLWTAAHKAYLGGSIDRPTAEAAISTLVPSVADREIVFENWDEESNLGGRAAAGA